VGLPRIGRSFSTSERSPPYFFRSEAAQHYYIDREPPPFEAVIVSATGVGKTYILAVAIEYLVGDGLVFERNRGNKYTARYIQLVVHEAATQAGIAQQVTPHRLRASVATILHDAGMPLDHVQKFL